MKNNIFNELLEQCDREEWEPPIEETKEIIKTCVKEIEKLRSTLFQIAIGHGMSPQMYQEIAKKVL